MENNLLDDFDALDEEKLEFVDEKKTQFIYIGFFNRLGAAMLDGIVLVVAYIFFMLIGGIDFLAAARFSPGQVGFMIGLVFFFIFHSWTVARYKEVSGKIGVI